MSDDEQTFDYVNTDTTGVSRTYPMQCSALRKNGYVVIKGRPCKIVEMSTSETGEHGQTKYLDVFPSTHNVDVPNISRRDYKLISIDDGFLSLIQEDGTMKDDLELPKGYLGDKMKEAFENCEINGDELFVSVVAAMGEEHASSYMKAPNP